jgi:hypothetical protein
MEYYDDDDFIQYVCFVCGITLSDSDIECDGFIDDFLCESCEKKTEQFIESLPDPLSPRLPPKIKTIDDWPPKIKTVDL